MGRCRRHPHHIVVGVCAYCLNEQLSALLEREDDGKNGSCVNTHLHSLHSPFAFTSSNPSTVCGTVPETPFAAPRRTPPRLPYDPGVDDVSPKASYHQCFSLSFSPQHRLRSDLYTPSYICSPQNQVFLGNHDFIKGEIPRKKKTSFWSFLYRHKPGFHNSCGAAYLQHNYVLDQDATFDHMYDDNHIHLQQQLQNKVRKDIHPTLRHKHFNGEKPGLDRHGLSKVVSSSAYMGSFGRDNAALQRVFVPQSSVSPNHQQKYPYLSKQRYSHLFSTAPTSIGLSPLRHEKHGDDDEGFSQGLQSAYAVHDINRYGDSQRCSPGLSSSWGFSIFPEKMRRSKSISGLSEVSDFGPTIQATSRLSRDIAATRARPVSCANEEMNGSPKRMQMKVAEGSVVKKSHNRSLNNYGNDTIYIGHKKSPTSTSPSGTYNTNHTQNSEAFPKSDAHSNNKRPHPSKPAALSLLSGSRPESVSIEYPKAGSVSPWMLAAQKKGSSPHGLFHGAHDRLVSPRRRNHAAQTHDDSGDVNGAMHRYMPPYPGLDESSTVPSDDECWRSPSLFDLNLAKSVHSKNPCKKVSGGHNSKDQQIKEPAFGSHVFAYSATRSLSKALGNMLGIRRGKKKSIKGQAVSPNDPNHCFQNDMDKMHNVMSMPNHIQNHHNAGYNDADDSDFIDYEQNDLYVDDYSHRDIPLASHGCVKVHELQAKESQVFPDLQDQKGPPQQYSFLSRDYSAFSCYFSPPSHAFQKAEVGTAQYMSSQKQMQIGNGAVCISRKSNSLSSTAMRSIRSRSRRG